MDKLFVNHEMKYVSSKLFENCNRVSYQVRQRLDKNSYTFTSRICRFSTKTPKAFLIQPDLTSGEKEDNKKSTTIYTWSLKND